MIGGSTSYFSTPPVVSNSAPALVQYSAATTADGSAGLTVSFPVPVTAGNSVIAFISFDGTGDVVLSVSPHAIGGASLNEVILNTDVPAAQNGIYCLPVAAGGETGVGFTTTGAVRASMQIIEVSGLADAAAEDVSTNSGNSGTPSTGSVTPTSASNLVVALAATADPDGFTAGFTEPPFTNVINVGASPVIQAMGYTIQSSATAQSPEAELVNGGDWAASAIALGAA